MAKESVDPVQIGDLDRRQVEQGLQELKTAHPICGVAVPGPSPLLLIRQPNGRSKWSGLQPFRNVGCFGASVSLAAAFDDGSATLTVVPRTHSAFGGLSSESIRLAFINGGKVLSAVELNGRSFGGLVAEAARHNEVLPDDSAHFWEVLACCFDERQLYPFRFSARDRLSIGWANRCRRELSQVWSFQQTLGKCVFPASNDVAPPLRDFVQAVQGGIPSLSPLFDYFDREIGNDFARLHEIQRQWDVSIDTSALSSDHFPEFNDVWETLPQSLWDAYMFLPKFTDYGRQVAWLDVRTKLIDTLRIDPANFPEGFAAEDYWQRVPHGNRVAWGTLVAGNDVFVSRETMENGWSDFVGAPDPKGALECSRQLFDEAVANKRGTIPSHAVVELRFGPFTHIELVESGNSVFGILRTENGEFYEVYMVPKERFCSFVLPHTVPIERLAPIEGGVLLLLAAIVRDFWVVEERETVFDHRQAEPRDSRGPLPSDTPRVVYLPRVHYHEPPNAPRCAETLGLHERRAHLVSPHRRRLGVGKQASDHQRILASMYGFDLQEGYTFVGPHERGKLKRETIYRSRSALQSLYRETTSVSGKPIRWFQFERDVHKLMESLGFEVEHIAASRRGDNGIDIYATKGSDFDQVNWVIQCKCWHPRRKITPNIVRELIGVLAGYPQGTRGILVATCGFSSGAIEAATAANIRTVDGAEYSALVEGQHK